VFRIFGPKRDKVTKEWIKLHNEELSDLYTSPNIVQVIKEKIMRWACSAYGGEKRHIRSWWGNLRERDQLGDPVMDGRIILRWFFRKLDVMVGSTWPRIWTGGGHK